MNNRILQQVMSPVSAVLYENGWKGCIRATQFAQWNPHDAIPTMQSAPRCNPHDAIPTMQSPRCNPHDAIPTMQSVQCNPHMQSARCNLHRDAIPRWNPHDGLGWNAQDGMRTMECARWNAHDGIRTMESARWSPHDEVGGNAHGGMCTMECAG